MVEWSANFRISDLVATPFVLFVFVLLPGVFGAILGAYLSIASYLPSITATPDIKYGYVVVGFGSGLCFGYWFARTGLFFPRSTTELEGLLSAYSPIDVAAYSSLRGSDRHTRLVPAKVLAWVRLERGALLATLVDPWFYGSASSLAKARSVSRDS